MEAPPAGAVWPGVSRSGASRLAPPPPLQRRAEQGLRGAFPSTAGFVVGRQG